MNAVCPGVINTEMVQRFTHDDPNAAEQLLATEPVGRMGTADEIADAVIWLCSSESTFVTGPHCLSTGASWPGDVGEGDEMTPAKQPVIAGSARSGFEPVREAFVENFTRRGELGAACCVYRDGEKVVDLWGGVRDRTSGEPWRADTMVVVHSTTKGLAAMVLALAHSRGWLDYDERVCTYWPEFAQAGKEQITVRQLLAHQAGLFAFDEKVDREVVADLDRLAEIMARQRPAWEPGERQAYHAISLGFYESELVRRIDPQHRQPGPVLRRGDRRAPRPRLLHRAAGVDPRRTRSRRSSRPASGSG